MNIKEYIYKLTEIVARDENLNVEIHPYYLLGYYNSKAFKEKMRIYKTKDKIREVTLPFREDAYAIGDEIHIFLGHCFTSKEFLFKEKHLIRDLTMMITHEIGHVKQEQNLDDYPYEEQLIFKMENILISISPDNGDHYRKNHDNYLLEIDADLFGSKKSYQIIKLLNVPTKDIENIKEFIHVSKIRKYNYDFEIIFEEIIRIIRENPDIIEENEYELFPLPLLYLREDLSFESLANIIHLNNEIKKDISGLSRKIITSEIYLTELDFKTLEDDEIEYLKDALEQRIEEEKKHIKNNSKLLSYKYLNKVYIKALIESSKCRINMYKEYLHKLEYTKK